MKAQILLLLSTVVFSTALIPSREYLPLYINERGTTFLQENYKDNVNNLLISDVPAHNDLVHTKWIFDLGSTGYMMQVQESLKTCTIQNSVFDASTLIDGFNRMQKSQGEMSYHKPMTANNSNTVMKEYGLLISTKSMPHALLPEKFQEHCPPTFEAFVAHTIDPEAATAENPLMVKENITHLADIYDYDPSMTHLMTKSRVKRNICETIDGTRYEPCDYVDITCQGGFCEPRHLRYQCSRGGGGGCIYILSGCAKEDGTTNDNCLMHIRSGDHKCNPCCVNKRCGSIGLCPGMTDRERELASLTPECNLCHNTDLEKRASCLLLFEC